MNFDCYCVQGSTWIGAKFYIRYKIKHSSSILYRKLLVLLLMGPNTHNYYIAMNSYAAQLSTEKYLNQKQSQRVYNLSKDKLQALGNHTIFDKPNCIEQILKSSNIQLKIEPILKLIFKLLDIMKVISVILLTLLALSATIANAYQNNMRLQFGSYVARAVGTAGRLTLYCTGGSGNYQFQINSGPSSWNYNNNVVTIPRIMQYQGQSFSIDLTIKDVRTGQILNTNAIISINGVRINVNEGGAIGGTFGTGSNSRIGSTSSSSASSSSSNSNNQNIAISRSVSELYESYDGLPLGVSPAQPSVSYSSPAGSPRIPNPAPEIIRNAQAPFDYERDTNKITINDVKRRAIFNRQINANKQVANIISIVQKLTANVNAAKNDLTILTNLLNDAENANAECQGVIFEYTNTQAKIQNAIADREASIAEINGRIAMSEPTLRDLQNQLNDLIRQRNQLENDRSPNSARLNSLENQLRKCREQKQKIQDELNDLNDEISQVKTDIKNVQDSAAAAPGQIRLINRQIPIIDNKIADLKAQLIATEAQKAQLLVDKSEAEELIASAQREVRRLRNVLSGLENRVPNLKRQIDVKQANCDRIEQELFNFRNQLAQIQSNYRILLEEIRAQETLVNNQINEINRYQASIGDIPNELKLLRAQSSRVDVALRRQFFLCEATADDVRRAKQNVEAMRIRLNRDSESLRVATGNLENARAEKQLADLQVEEIIAQYTTALPFSVIPRANSVGSTQTQNTVSIGDLNTYLSSAYRAGVDPARPSTVTNLYPLSVTTRSTIAGQNNRNLYNFGCNSDSGNSYAGQGQVISVQPGIVRINTDQGAMNLQIAGCTNIESTRPGQILEPNDMVYFRGNKRPGNFVQTTSMTCV